MDTMIEMAIAAYTSSRSKEALRDLDRALAEDTLIVPVLTAPTEIDDETYDLPVICLRTTAGDGAIPAFTTVEQLLNWKPAGCKYVTMPGRALLKMALRMPDISQIVINVDGSPRGAIPRVEFERLIALK